MTDNKTLTATDLYLLRARLRHPGREMPGLTQAEMAELLGISHAQYGLYERGKTPIRKSVAIVVRMLLQDERRRGEQTDDFLYSPEQKG